MGARNPRETTMINTFLAEERTSEWKEIDFINWSSDHMVDCCIIYPPLIIFLLHPVLILNYFYLKKHTN